LVCFGPIDPFNGLIYEMDRERFLVSGDGHQSDISISDDELGILLS
jgi:hypothetical protein